MNRQMEESDAELRTLYCGNLDEKVGEELLYELFLQAGPLEKVRLPRDTGGFSKGFAFIEFKHECSVPYAINLFEDTSLYGKFMRLRFRHNQAHQRSQSLPMTFGQQVPGPSPNKDYYDSLLEMSQKLLPGQPPQPWMTLMGPPLLAGRGMPMAGGPPPPIGMGMPMAGGPGMPPPPGIHMEPPPPSGVEGQAMGQPWRDPYLRRDGNQMEPPPPPGVEGQAMGQPWRDPYLRRDGNQRNTDWRSLSQTSLQGNWSARNASHMLPEEDYRRSSRSDHHPQRNRDRGSHHRDRESHRDDRRSRSDDRHGDNRDHHQSHYSRDRSYNRDSRRDHRGDNSERWGRH